MRWKEQYGKLQCRIRICEQGGSDKIHSELKKAEEEYKENTMLLEEKARSSRSLAVQRLIRAQLDYRQKTADLMKDDIIKDMHSEDNSLDEDKTEGGSTVRGICDGLCHACHAAGADLSPGCAGQTGNWG